MTRPKAAIVFAAATAALTLSAVLLRQPRTDDVPDAGTSEVFSDDGEVHYSRGGVMHYRSNWDRATPREKADFEQFVKNSVPKGEYHFHGVDGHSIRGSIGGKM